MKWHITLSLVLLLGAACPALAQTGSSLEQVKAAAEAGNPAAQDELAGKYIMRLDTKHAEFWYRKAATQGYAHAQGKLAEMLLNHARMSFGLKPDDKQAIGEEGLKWALLAANQGDQLGPAMLAEAYSEGKFVKQDWVQAYKWAALAAQQPGAMFNPAGVLAGSIRDSAILKLSDQQLAEAKKLVADFSPHATAKNEMPTPAWVKEIKLSGLSGPSDHRLAIINDTTFAVAAAEFAVVNVASRMGSGCCHWFRFQRSGLRSHAFMAWQQIPSSLPPQIPPAGKSAGWLRPCGWSTA